MDFQNYKLGKQLLGVSNCPHCDVASPLLDSVWNSNGPLERSDGGAPRQWAAFRCTTCGAIVTAEVYYLRDEVTSNVLAIYPSVWQPNDDVPEQARTYLTQAHQTLTSPDASVLMSASAIDAMLKEQGLKDGSLFNRIDEAVAKGILTAGMARWAHQTRVDSNNTRHADEATPHMSREDARRAFEFAKAIAEILYVLPGKMPKPQTS